MSYQKIQTIKSILNSLPDAKLDGLKSLFWEELNYEHANQPIPTPDWDDDLRTKFAEPPVLFATAANDNSFHIIYGRLTIEKMSISLERAVINRLVKEHPHSLFVFSNASQTHWHFVNAVHEKDEKAQRRRVLRRISVSKEDRLRTASERITLLDTALAQQDLFGLDPFAFQKQHERAFDVEAVTAEFFNDYQTVFRQLVAEMERQTGDRTWAHDFALQFLNRLMFLYYIERKRWLGDNPDFLHHYWRAYKNFNQEADTFVSKWLEILFFEAFNKKFSSGRSDVSYIPEEFRNALQLAPWLNGGLFSKNGLDSQHPYRINDAMVKHILDFLNNYNFTISEDTPLDQEVAVDPEMIGKVYESLVNVSSETDEQGDAGIFYTPRIEIDLMCRLSLVDWLSNHLPEIQKSVFYEFVFAFDPEDKRAADQALTRLNLWPTVDRLLTELTVLDPACGSGSFLVGMLLILDDLLARCAAALGRPELPYDRRKRIVGNSLYGVDIMEWAVHVAELRLWLQLVIDTEIDENELRLRPLLPNLSFKIRRGDSLVQEIGGINLGLRRSGGQLPRTLAGKINALKAEKMKYFHNEENRKYRTLQDVEQDERLLFREIIEAELHSKLNRRDELSLVLAPATNLFGEVQNSQIKLDAVLKKRELEQVNESIEKLRQALQVLKNASTIPFVWDISFVEIFEGEKGGFDIVIGNPPYVRQEKIHDPALLAEQVTPENKKEYKNKLARAVYATYPQTFGYQPGADKAAWTLDRKSDYYVYFYFICLSLLNDKGSFCFITSNSWLDVGYGADLQRFLLTRSKVKLILDNQVKRSFKSADVNTIIALLAPPRDRKEDLKEPLDHLARFVMFCVPFENGLSPVLWEEVEDAQDRLTTAETRIVVKAQSELLESGMDAEKSVYAGDKWGGKYLRAPDIYWVIMEKCRDKLVRLGDIADVRRGITTGANEFFYLDESKIQAWGIEEEFLVPVIKSSRELINYEYSGSSVKYHALFIEQNKQELKGKNVLEYLKWGEQTGIDEIPSVRGRSQWWTLPRIFGNTFWGKELRERVAVFSSSDSMFADCRLYLAKTEDILKALLNSAISILLSEVLARDLGGGGGPRSVMVYEVQNQMVPNPNSLTEHKDLIIAKYNTLKSRPVFNINSEFKEKDRIELDRIVGISLGLTVSEIESVYGAVLHQINKRLAKAESV